MAGEVIEDPIIKEATDALKGRRRSRGREGRRRSSSQPTKELLTLHELIAHRLVQILIGQHRGRDIPGVTTAMRPGPPRIEVMGGLGRTLMIFGAMLFVIGLIVTVGGRFLPFGRLPGDIVVRRPNFTFYFPVVTSILLSILLTVILWFFQRR